MRISYVNNYGQIVPGVTISAAQVSEARGWLQDCGYPVPQRDGYVMAVVERMYDGGVAGFLRDTAALAE